MSGAPDVADPALVTELTVVIADGAVPELDPVELAQTGKAGWTIQRLEAALEALTTEGVLTPVEKHLCPVPTCRQPISPEDIASGLCPHCATDFRTLEVAKPIVRTVYRHGGPISRDLQWAIVIHGMNTLGPWQEELSWRLALKLRYSAPVLIYKYGKYRVGVLFRAAHRAAVRRLGARIANSVALAVASNRTRPPDVILHSFATLLFAKLLDEPMFRDLRFGRVILAGSIVRPDYNWHRHIDAGRVEAILNHCGSKDHIVDLAAFAIPDTGPSGRIGSLDPVVLSVRAEGYDHSTFFKDRGLNESLAPGGLWDRFLRVPVATLQPEKWISRSRGLGSRPSCLPAIRSPTRSMLQPRYSQRPAALAHSADWTFWGMLVFDISVFLVPALGLGRAVVDRNVDWLRSRASLEERRAEPHGPPSSLNDDQDREGDVALTMHEAVHRHDVLTARHGRVIWMRMPLA